MDTNFILRPDSTQNVFLSEDAIDVEDILKSKYGYIYDSIQNEGFILKYSQCNLFKELICDKKVVGFCSYDFSREFMTVALNNIYILPEFRGNGIFLNELKKTMAEHNKPSIMEPTRLVVELLIKYGFASKVTDNIVASAVEFIVPGSHVMSNGEYLNEELSTHFYDLEMCASFHILDLNKSHIAYSLPLNYDIIHYDCLFKRQNLDEDYFKGLVDLFKDKSVEFMEVILNLEDALPTRKYTLEEVIGSDDELSPYIESLIDDAHVTYEKALEIRRQIREEYESGMILSESLLIRLAYLFESSAEPRIKSHDDTCPYCGMPTDSHDRFCHFCGINLDYDLDGIENSLFESINSTKSDFAEDIRFIAYKFLKLIDEKIEFDYSVFTIENTYNIDRYDLKVFVEKNGYIKDSMITEKGYEFLENHPLHFFEKYHMDLINYTDFENYFYQHPEIPPIERCLNYLNQYDEDKCIKQIIDEISQDLND